MPAANSNFNFPFTLAQKKRVCLGMVINYAKKGKNWAKHFQFEIFEKILNNKITSFYHRICFLTSLIHILDFLESKK
jgi:hypothetical protein